MVLATARRLRVESATPADLASVPSVSPVVQGFSLDAFAPISLAEMDDVALLNRSDTKYVLNPRTLAEVVNGLCDEYRVLEIAGFRAHPYRTIYFDTPEFALYYDHHRRRPRRYKVRSREYAQSGMSFFEVKSKDKRDQTSKVRIPTPAMVREIHDPEQSFLDANVPAPCDRLSPSLWNDFHRITLVSARRPERVTIDVSLRFSANGRVTFLSGVAIAEVKQAHGAHDSDLFRAMRARHLHPVAFSKYCVGAALHYDHLKHNRFAQELRLVDRLMQEAADVC